MLNSISNVTKKSIVRNAAIVATGAAGAQAITIAFSPIITRLYGPEAFGLLGTFMALVAILVPLVSLAYPIAIVLPKKDSDARGIARLSFYISLLVTAFFALAIIIVGDHFLSLFSAQSVAAFSLLIPINILFLVWKQIVHQWLIRKKNFKIDAIAAVLQSLIVYSAKSIIGLFAPLVSVLILLSTLGNVFHVALLFLWIIKSERTTHSHQQIQKHTPLIDLARRHYDFPLYRAPQMFINSVSRSLPVLMLAAFFGPASAGFYVLGHRLLSMPTHLIGTSVLDVFYPRISEAAHKGENLGRLILNATLALAAFSTPFILIIVIFGPWIFGFVFGIEWVVAGEYARWLALWLYFAFINRPSVAAIPVLNLQGYFLIYEIFSIGFRVAALLIGFIILKNDIFAIALFSFAGAILNFILITFTIHRSHSFCNNQSSNIASECNCIS